MRILVTGGTGFIGSHLIREALRRGIEVTAFCRHNSNFGRIEDLTGRIDWLTADPSDGKWKLALKEKFPFDCVVHLATSYGRNGQLDSEVLSSNLIFPLELLEICIEMGSPLFLNTDTCFPETYGYLQSYTRSKKDFKRWGQKSSNGGKTRFITMELQHPFGPGDGEGKFIPWLVRQCRIPGNTIPMTTGEQRKDFIYISDVVDAYFCSMNRATDLPSNSDTLEIGRGEGVSIRWIAETINLLCGNKATLQFGALPQRDGETLGSKADITAIASLGWCPQRSVIDGLRVLTCEMPSNTP
jgi:nucleoside-diphosphate-sugar epimerase